MGRSRRHPGWSTAAGVTAFWAVAWAVTIRLTAASGCAAAPRYLVSTRFVGATGWAAGLAG